MSCCTRTPALLMPTSTQLLLMLIDVQQVVGNGTPKLLQSTH